jgi:peptidoglycan/LPS O-acetylase OafA/YrhL
VATSPQRPNDKPALTAVRGLAACGVFLAHSRLPSAIQEAQPLLVNVKEVGWIGVPIFFVLSGYLLTWLGLAERAEFGQLNLLRFYLRRILRIFPLYFAVSVMCLLAWNIPHTQGIAASPGWALPITTFTTNFFLWAGKPARVLGALIPLWTVAAEEQFYLFWGWMLRYGKGRTLSTVVIAGLVLSLVLRLLPWNYPSFLRYRFNPGVSLGSMMAGCLLAIHEQKIRRFVGGRDLAWLAIAGCVLVTLIGWPVPADATRAALLTCLVDLVAVVIVFEGARNESRLSRMLSGRRLIYAGELSYAIYLVHFAIITLYLKAELHVAQLISLETTSPYLSFMLELMLTGLVTFGVSVALTRLESPFRRLRFQLHREPTNAENSQHVRDARISLSRSA